MTVRWEAVRDAIAVRVDALVPETDANCTYHDAASDSVLEGASGRRAHWQDPPSWEWMQSQSGDTARVRYTWQLNLLLSRGAMSIPDFVRACPRESFNIARAILTMEPPPGADAVQVLGANTTASGDADTVQIQINLICEVDEDL